MLVHVRNRTYQRSGSAGPRIQKTASPCGGTAAARGVIPPPPLTLRACSHICIGQAPQGRPSCAKSTTLNGAASHGARNAVPDDGVFGGRAKRKSHLPEVRLQSRGQLEVPPVMSVGTNRVQETLSSRQVWEMTVPLTHEGKEQYSKESHGSRARCSSNR